MADKEQTVANTYGVALELWEIDSKAHTIRGRVALDTPPLVSAGDEITVAFGRGDAHWQLVENSLKKGQAAPVKNKVVDIKSLVVLENVYRDGSGQIIARWVRTARSALKTMDESSRHDHRDVVRAWVTEPALAFKNPNTDGRDPDYVEWPVTAKAIKAYGRDKVEHVYDLAWLQSRLQEVRRIPDIPVSVRLLSCQPKSALAHTEMNRESAKQAVTGLLEQGHQAFVLFQDPDGKVHTQRVWSAENGNTALDFHNLPATGLRVLPASTLFFGTDSANVLIDAVAKGNCPFGIKFLFVPPGQSAAASSPREARVDDRAMLAPVLLTVSDWNGDSSETEKPDGASPRLYIQTPDLVKLLPNATYSMGDMVFRPATLFKPLPPAATAKRPAAPSASPSSSVL